MWRFHGSKITEDLPTIYKYYTACSIFSFAQNPITTELCSERNFVHEIQIKKGGTRKIDLLLIRSPRLYPITAVRGRDEGTSNVPHQVST